MTLEKGKEQDGMMLAKVKEQDGIMLANVKVPSIPTSAACCDDVQLTNVNSSSPLVSLQQENYQACKQRLSVTYEDDGMRSSNGERTELAKDRGLGACPLLPWR